jgi:small-conductance mechanosensitive channel
MLFLFDKIIRTTYGQDEIDIGIGSEGGSNMHNSEGSELSVSEDAFGPISSSSSPADTITGLGSYVDSIIFSIIVVSIALTTYFIIRFFINRYADSLNLDRRQLAGVNSITKITIIVVTIIILIFHFSSLSGVAAGAISVAAGTIIGFSSRNTISNAIAGILLLSARPFKLGDRIRTTEDESLIGDVIEISLLYTKIKTIRNELVAIPNQTLLQRQIVNYSGLDVLSITVNITMTYNNKRELIEKLLIQSAKATDGILTSQSISNELMNSRDNSAPDNAVTDPYVLLVRFGDYGAIYDLRAYTNKPREFLKIASEIRKKIYDSFQVHGIDLTVPQAQIGFEKVSNNDEFNQNNNNLKDLR